MKKKTTKLFSFQKLVIILLLSSILPISGCYLDLKGHGNLGTDPEEITPVSAETHFSLNLPTSLNEGERIILEILDEVTGLPYNGRFYDMTMVSAQEYILDLSFQSGSVVKYRYHRMGAALSHEAAADGTDVRYRLLSINGETTVSDVLQSWQGDSSPAPDAGSLTGTVIDQATQQPLADILVSVGGNLSFTDANGHFTIQRLTPGVQNVVFYATDGQYRTYQQGAVIVSGLTTTADVMLTEQPLVQVTFHVTTPNNALGIPVYLAGNLLQLGNTFTDLNGGMSVKPKQMPMLIPQEDGTFKLTLDLHVGTDLRYKFTLGDGYWNAERTDEGGINVRQLIVPDHSVSLDLSIASWRSPGVVPVTFNVTIPVDNDPGDEKYIQLGTTSWTEPLPLWPLGNGDYIFIVFSPLDVSAPLSYRFCRNEDCEQAMDAESVVNPRVIQPAETAQSVQLSISDWQNWHRISEPTSVVAANVPQKADSFQTWIELTPEMTPAWRMYTPIGLSSLPEMGVGTVLLSPQWFISSEDSLLHSSIGATPFKTDLVSIIDGVNALGMDSGLFPRLGPTDKIQTLWTSQVHSETWWQDWFTSYRFFILNYAQIAAETQAEWFVIGGKDVMPAFPGGVYADSSASDVPESFNDQWLQLISEIRSFYTGKLVWATNAQVSMDPLPHFVDMFDGLYITVDSPLATTVDPSLDELSFNFEAVINSQVYEVFQSTQKPIIIGLAYPSVESSYSGCTLIDQDCSNDGIFIFDEIADRAINLDEQVAIYNATLPVLATQDWIDGIAIRGYDPILVKLDGSSSIAGKPAMDVIWYWFSGLAPD